MAEEVGANTPGATSCGSSNTRRPGEDAPRVRLGVLVPQFPGQTHGLFRREARELRRVDVVPLIISTREPPSQDAGEPVNPESDGPVEYLWPLSLSDLVKGLGGLLEAGPRRWAQVLSAALRFQEASAREKAKVLALVPSALRLQRYCREQNIGHVHVHSCASSATLAMVGRLLGGVTYSLTLHSDLAAFGPGQREKWCNASFGFAVSTPVAEQLANLVPELNADVVDIVPMGVDLEIFEPEEEAQAEPENTSLRVVSCGRLHINKGHQDVVSAIDKVRQRGVDVSLEIVGGGLYRGELLELVAKLGLEGRVKLAGRLSEKGVRDVLAKGDVFCLGSFDEAIGVATMEAMAMGLPVIVTRVGGVPELVRDGVDGWLVEPNSPEQIADALVELVADRERGREMGRAGRARVVASFSSKRSAEALQRRVAANSDG